MKKIALIFLLYTVSFFPQAISQRDSVSIPNNTDIFSVQIDSSGTYVWRRLGWWRLWNSSALTNNTFPATLNLANKTIAMDGLSTFTMYGEMNFITGATFKVAPKSTIGTYRHFGYTGADGSARLTFNYGTNLTDSLMNWRDMELMKSSIVPFLHKSYNLGSNTRHWRAVYTDTVIVKRIVDSSGGVGINFATEGITLINPATGDEDSTLTLGGSGNGNQLKTVFTDEINSPNQLRFTATGNVKSDQILADAYLTRTDTVTTFPAYTLESDLATGVIYLKPTEDVAIHYIYHADNADTFSTTLTLMNISAYPVTFKQEGNIKVPNGGEYTLAPKQATQVFEYYEGANQSWMIQKDSIPTYSAATDTTFNGINALGDTLAISSVTISTATRMGVIYVNEEDGVIQTLNYPTTANKPAIVYIVNVSGAGLTIQNGGGNIYCRGGADITLGSNQCATLVEILGASQKWSAQ